METCVLLPREFSLILQPGPPGRALEMGVTLWTNCTLSPGMLFRPDEGEIKLDKLEVYSLLREKDVRQEFGCTDSICDVDENDVRHCNWVRFLNYTYDLEKVNMIASKVRGNAVFRIIKTIPPNTELVAFFDRADIDSREEDIRAMPVKRPLPDIKPDDEPSSGSPQSSPLPMVDDFVSPNSLKSPATLISPSSELDSRSNITSPTTSEDYERNSSDISPKVGAVSPQDVTPTGKDGGDKSSPGSWSSFSSPSGSSNPYTPDMTSVKGDYRALHQMPLRRKEKTWLPCEVCGKKFDRPSLLKRHMRTHTGEKPHACDVCGKAFSTSSSLNTHRRIHSGEKPHQCQVCGKRFTASSNLYYHRMTHKKEKPHKCNLCSKSFPTPGDLKSHMYVHNGSWPYKCDICNRGFSKQTNLKNHMLLHTGDKPHECPLCLKKFALQCNLKTHVKTHEDEPQERCLRCGNVFLASRHQLNHGVCRDCRGPVPPGAGEGRTVNPFSIEALVSPDRHTRKPDNKTTCADNGSLAKSPYYASAMMSTGMLPMPFGNGAGHYGMAVGWPPTPMGQRYGI